MDTNTIRVLVTAMLVLIGTIQIGILRSQRKNNQLQLIEVYRKRWANYKNSWGTIIFIAKDDDEYYQVVNQEKIKKLVELRDKSNHESPSIWALDATREIFPMFSDICTKILQKQLDIRDVYPIFTTELLRNSRSLKVLLEQNLYDEDLIYMNEAHKNVRKEVQEWLIYHDGLRRRCLILIDLLWAEATRLEDLPPEDIISAADVKIKSGSLNKKRLFKECIRLNGYSSIVFAYKLSRFLNFSEYKKGFFHKGKTKKELELLDEDWTKRLLAMDEY